MGFVRAKTTGFAAIVPGPVDPWEALFVSGNRAAKINLDRLISEGPLLDAYDKQLAGIPEPFASRTEAAFDVRGAAGTRRTVFIVGDQCLDWEWGVAARYQGPITDLPGFGLHIPDGFRSDLDTLMGLPDGSTMLFKTDQCAIIKWGADGGCTYKGAVTGTPGWNWLSAPPDMVHDFDDAVMIKAPDLADEETLLIKANKAMILHWRLGLRRIGTYAEVAAGLGALPPSYQTSRRDGQLSVPPPPPQRTPPLPAKSTLTTDTPTVAKGAPLTVRYSTPASKVSSKNWVGLYPAGSTVPPQESFVWTYTPDASGSATLDTGRLPGPGSYSAWYFYDDGYTTLAGPLNFTAT
ncbi:hypothetical protein [Actinomadura harenae]|uniref:Uncharacterized protein n=1 Tax=Actinomadura harenae TaxID=2483351 RepID=A0A3M2M1U4_9ACTN|nr:hypothetical protein [Actinomadura harenae]RMI42415.1 hypothetical protein EBO15_19435 [Actinomadura harenae]